VPVTLPFLSISIVSLRHWPMTQPSIISSRQVIFLDQASGHDLNLALFGVDIAAYGTVNIDISLGDNIAVKADAAGDNRGGRFAETADGDSPLSTGVFTVGGVASMFLFFLNIWLIR
jgi:hypothetical protein